MSGRNWGSARIQPEKILAWCPMKNGRWFVNLYSNTVRSIMLIHRAVAMAFLDNPDNLPEVNHNDGNPSNNNILNLEWCTSSHNKLHAYRIGLKKPTYKPIIQYSTNWQFIKEHQSLTHAAKEMGCKFQNISNAALKPEATCGGFRWAYKTITP